MENDELSGTLVLVHPKLFNDPAARQGQIGIIASAVLDRDDIYVGFGAGPLALYSADALLVLRQAKDIYQTLLLRSKLMDPADFKALFQISLLMDYGENKSLKTAMELASKSDAVRAASLIPLEEKLIALGYKSEAGPIVSYQNRR